MEHRSWLRASIARRPFHVAILMMVGLAWIPGLAAEPYQTGDHVAARSGKAIFPPASFTGTSSPDTLAKQMAREGYVALPLGRMKISQQTHGEFLMATEAQSRPTRHRASNTPPGISAFVDVNVIPMDSERVLPHQTVIVNGDRVVALGPARDVAVPAGAQHIDGHGKYLLPGLADMHVHICAPPCNPSSTSLDQIYRDLLPYLANGITTVRDMHSGGADSPLLAAKKAVAAGKVLGPRIYTAGDPENYYVSRVRASAEGAAASTVPLKAAGHDFVKFNGWAGDVYDSVLAASRRVHLPIVGHVPPDRRLETIINDHWASIEHLMGYLEYTMGVDGRWNPAGMFMMDFQSAVDTAAWMKPAYSFPDEGLRAIAAATRQAGLWNCPTLFANVASLTVLRSLADSEPENVRLKAGVQVFDRWREFYFRITKTLQEAGAGLLLGTDADADLRSGVVATPIPGFAIHAELQLLVQAGLTPYQALATGTHNAAVFLGTEDSTGTITVGKRADLILLNGNPLQDIHATVGPAGVMIGGRWLSQAVFDDAKTQTLHWLPDGYPGTVLKQFYPELWTR